MKKLAKVVLALSMVGAISTYSFANKDNSDFFQKSEKFVQVLRIIKNVYVEEKSYKELFDHAIQGMLTKLDPHSAYLTEDDFDKSEESTSGKFAGVGMTVEKDEKTGFIRVVSPIHGTPAEKAGMKSGDLVIKIADTFTDSLPFKDGVNMLRGKPKTKVTIKVWRGKQEPFDVTITRAIIKVPSIKAELLDNNIGHIRIIQFQEKTTADLKNEIKKLNKKSKNKIRGFIIDLRNNPGGLLSEAISISDSFLNKGEIVSIRGRNKENARRWNAKKGDLTNNKPIVVLVNRGSASASEIVAGALQDHKRAIIVGDKTFGKGSVQSIIPIGEKESVKLTTARYYTPSGRSIQKLGIVPDIRIPNLIIEKELDDFEYGEDKLSGAIDNPQKDKKDGKKVSVNDKLKEKETGKPVKNQSLNITDYSLARAIDILETVILTNVKR
ncbi:MAG: S41 family peptidase [Alphaproteobacteria bacterium]